MRSIRVLWLAIASSLILCATAAAATPELSVSSRLQDRREVAAGQRAYAQGYEDGRFYANGFHISGEMGGIWAPPLKLADGVWFGVDGNWVGQATRFTSGWGYVRYAFPDVAGLHVSRTDFAPDGQRAVLFGLTLTNPGAARTADVAVDAHSDLLGAYPWGTTTPYSAANEPADQGAYDGHELVFTNDGTPGPAALEHHYAALVASPQTPSSGVAAASGGGYRGPQPGTRCAASDQTSAPSACDDGPYGHGTGGELHYAVSLPAHGSATVWIAVAGSDQGIADGRSQLAGALKDPAGELAAKIAARRALSRFTQVSLPGDPLLQRAISWGKQNLADLTQTASNLQIRWTNQGTEYPAAPLGTVPHAEWFAAGYPDYPWLFATDGEYTAYAAVGLGQFQTIEDHLLALRDVSQILNGSSGIVAHETVSDGSVYFGQNSPNTSGSGTSAYNFNTDETVKLPSTVALVWRWTGDSHFMGQMYGFVRESMHTIADQYAADPQGWPLGSGNVERAGMGPEKLDNAVYFIRGLIDLADLARYEHDPGTAHWATALAGRLQARFESDWWDASAGQYAESLQTTGQQVFQKHWIGVVPMEAELTPGQQTVPGVASRPHALQALAARETACFSGSRPGSLGLFHTGCGGGADGKGDFEIFSLTTSVMAVGLGNYGLLDRTQQQRYTDANAETMFSEPATGGTPDEQPGAMPEIFPSSPNGDPSQGVPANIDRCWTCRSQVMQAWGNYGTVWPVVHQQLGIEPFIPQGELDVVPQVPADQPSVAGQNVRLGAGAADVFASHAGRRYTTTVALHGLRLRRLRLGTTLPRGSRVRSVTLDGRRLRRLPRGALRATNRGLELTLAVARGGEGGPHTLIVTTG